MGDVGVWGGAGDVGAQGTQGRMIGGTLGRGEIRARGDVGLWGHGDMGMWGQGDMGIWGCGDMEI